MSHLFPRAPRVYTIEKGHAREANASHVCLEYEKNKHGKNEIQTIHYMEGTRAHFS